MERICIPLQMTTLHNVFGLIVFVKVCLKYIPRHTEHPDSLDSSALDSNVLFCPENVTPTVLKILFLGNIR